MIANVQNHTNTLDTSKASGALASIGSAFLAAMIKISHNSGVRAAPVKLTGSEALSDAELAGLGLRRADIIRHAFRPYSYM